MKEFEPERDVRGELEGWRLFWERLEVGEGGEEALERLCGAVAAEARRRWQPGEVSQDPRAAELRRLFRAAGCDPTRYRPSSEALLRRLLKGDDLPAIHPLVDFNNCLSVRLMVPCCVLAAGSFAPPVTLRAGREEESFESLRGPFQLDGKPLLADGAGPFGTPITDSVRVKVLPQTRSAWLVAYLPAAAMEADEARRALDDLLEEAGGAVRRMDP